MHRELTEKTAKQEENDEDENIAEKVAEILKVYYLWAPIFLSPLYISL